MGYDFDKLSGEVISAALAVHRSLGAGFLESIYEQSLKIELVARGYRVESQKAVPVSYAGQLVGTHVLDIVVDGQLIIELKAVKCFEDIHFAQLRSYLKATGLRVGLLMNFGDTTLTIKRVVNKW